VDLRRVNRRVLESLVKCGAFDTTGGRRSQLTAILDDAMNLGQRIQQERESAQVSLFGTAEIAKGNGNGNGNGKLPEIPEWDAKLLLSFEKEAIGFFITGHPLGRHIDDMKRLATADCASLAELPDKSEVRICGIVAGLKESITKKGDRMGFVTLEDLTGSVEVIVFPETFARAVEHLKSEAPLVVSGTVDIGEKSIKIKAADIIPLSDMTERETKRVLFTLRTAGLGRKQLESLKVVIDRYRGNCRVCLRMELPEQCAVTINLPDSYTVAAREDLSLEVESLLGYNAVSFK
jgi:DNA polymerase III subunit alpha